MTERPLTEGPSTCREIAEAITEYLEGGLTSADRLAFERHVAICPPCRGYLSQIRTVVRVGRGLREEEIPERVRDDLAAVFAAWKARADG